MSGQVLVLAEHRVTRRQIARAIISGGMDVVFVDGAEQLINRELTTTGLVIIDADTTPRDTVVMLLTKLSAAKSRPPVVLLSIGENKNPLVELIRSYEIGNLVAKHGAIRAAHPVVDERELLVTAQKVLKKEIFGVEKYVGAWGVVVHRRTIKALSDKSPVLDDLEKFLAALDTPSAVLPDILTVADEFIVNAVVHAPRNPDGTARYEHLGPTADIRLDPTEYVEVSWACDAQRLMLSVSDNFGALNRATVLGYVSRGLGGAMQVESKTSGAGIGLSMSFLSIHQLIFNIHEKVRTEAIAGWYLRVNTAVEFRQVAKSLNVFFLSDDPGPKQRTVVKPPLSRDIRADARLAPPKVTEPQLKPVAQVVALAGRIDERTNMSAALKAQRVDLSKVVNFSSRGVMVWVNFVQSLSGAPVELVGAPEAFIRLASDVVGVVSRGLYVRTVMAPWECQSCTFGTTVHMYLEEVVAEQATVPCPSCGEQMKFASDPADYEKLLPKKP